jgi:hypothetical protein
MLTNGIDGGNQFFPLVPRYCVADQEKVKNF